MGRGTMSDPRPDRVRVIVCGDRRWACEALARRVLGRLVARRGDRLTIVHGGGSGVDAAFDRRALIARVDRVVYPAARRLHGADAAERRNQEMVDAGARGGAT